MKYEFQSPLKNVIQELIDEKRALGYKYETELKNLKRLDKLAIQKGLTRPVISREFAEEFIRTGLNEKPINSTHRVGIIRVLAEYMNRKGLDAYVIPPLPIGSYRQSFVPHIYTDDELRKLFYLRHYILSIKYIRWCIKLIYNSYIREGLQKMNNHDVAIRVEHLLRDEFGFNGRPRGTIFDADNIELYSFYDCLNLLLYKKSKNDYSEFLDSIYEYKLKNMREIPDSESVYREFRRLLFDGNEI